MISFTNEKLEQIQLGEKEADFDNDSDSESEIDYNRRTRNTYIGEEQKSMLLKKKSSEKRFQTEKKMSIL